jgi:hypothetical protein
LPDYIDQLAILRPAKLPHDTAAEGNRIDGGKIFNQKHNMRKLRIDRNCCLE